MLATGNRIRDYACISDVVDFYYGVITTDTTNEQREKLDMILRGETEGVATSAEVQMLDEFEAMLAEMRAGSDDG